MLESVHIKNTATYTTDGIEIAALNKVNFIYGANGSGKTTLTRVLDKPNEPVHTDCSINWLGGIELKTLVYNKDFRTANFGNGSIEGVFTLGQASKEQIAAIAKMNADLEEIKQNGLRKKASLDKVSGLLEAHHASCRELFWPLIYKTHEEVFKDAFVGYMKSKEVFRLKVIEEYMNNNAALKPLNELTTRAETIFGEQPTELKLLTTVDFQRLLELEADAIWEKKIIGSSDVDIAALIQRIGINDWVNEGRQYLVEDKTCPFCQQETITDEFINQLEGYFDETFNNDTKRVKELHDEYAVVAEAISNLLTQIETNEKDNKDSHLDLDHFSAHLRTLITQLSSNKELLSAKIKEPSRGISLLSLRSSCEELQKLLQDANTSIVTHNKIVSNYPAEKNRLIQEIWQYLIQKSKKEITSYLAKERGLSLGISNLTAQKSKLETDYKNLREQVRIANKGVTSVQPTVDEINRILKSFGFLNFEIVPSKSQKNYYQILREDGTSAEPTLSEGEVTFITFLYFLQLAKGSTKEDRVSEPRILVIDDPISSLDSNVLFVVSSLLKEIIRSIRSNTGNIKQLIILTHNVYFHKEVSFIDGRTKENADTFFWILRKNKNSTEIEAFEKKNPINTSYELLWRELTRPDLSGITTQNIMRRIIESYFKLVGKYGDDDLINRFPSAQEKEICRSLICWINDGSHGVSEDLFVEQIGVTVEKYQEVFKNIFKYMNHEEHYTMMTAHLAN